MSKRDKNKAWLDKQTHHCPPHSANVVGRNSRSKQLSNAAKKHFLLNIF